MDAFDSAAVRRVVSRLRALTEQEKDRLTELDAALGDGDLGFVMVRGVTAAEAAVLTGDDADPGRLLMKAGMAIAKEAPSTMGTLAATGFMRGGKAVAGKESLGTESMASFFDAFLAGIMERGKAQPGDKTVIDALAPAVESLDRDSRNNVCLADALASALDACISGAESTSAMIAKHGRPSYYGDKTIGMPDPGSQFGVLIFRAFAEEAVND